MGRWILAVVTVLNLVTAGTRVAHGDWILGLSAFAAGVMSLAALVVVLMDREEE